MDLHFYNYKYVLQNEINNRYHSRLLFEDPDLWYLLYSLIEVACLVEQKQTKLGDIYPSNINWLNGNDETYACVCLA